MSQLLFIGNVYSVTDDNKCYYNNIYVPLKVYRRSDGTIESSEVDFKYMRENIEPWLYEELGFKNKEICPRNGPLQSCWQLNIL